MRYLDLLARLPTLPVEERIQPPATVEHTEARLKVMAELLGTQGWRIFRQFLMAALEGEEQRMFKAVDPHIVADAKASCLTIARILGWAEAEVSSCAAYLQATGHPDPRVRTVGGSVPEQLQEYP